MIHVIIYIILAIIVYNFFRSKKGKEYNKEENNKKVENKEEIRNLVKVYIEIVADRKAEDMWKYIDSNVEYEYIIKKKYIKEYGYIYFQIIPNKERQDLRKIVENISEMYKIHLGNVETEVISIGEHIGIRVKDFYMFRSRKDSFVRGLDYIEYTETISNNTKEVLEIIKNQKDFPYVVSGNKIFLPSDITYEVKKKLFYSVCLDYSSVDDESISDFLYALEYLNDIQYELHPEKKSLIVRKGYHYKAVEILNQFKKKRGTKKRKL